MSGTESQLPWLEPGEAFPDLAQAWGSDDPLPGLLAGGGALDVPTLRAAYSQGIFPWFSEGQPILWWSPDPRMVLQPKAFKLQRSLRKSLLRFRASTDCEIRFDSAFEEVIRACAGSPRDGQAGTWITTDIIAAYRALHAAGLAHSVETWQGGRLVGGLYCVAIGRAVFGESMFTRVPDASKIALAALVCFCKAHGIGMIDCQQNTRHLASLGACEIARSRFVHEIAQNVNQPAPLWHFVSVYWQQLLTESK